jgi:ACT domain-containing protein
MIATKDVTIASQEGNLFAFANTDFQISTASGVVSLKAGDKLDMRSAKAMTIKTEADGLNMISIGAVTETFSSTQSTTIGGTLTTSVTGAVSETFSAGQTTTVDGSLVMSGSSGVNVSSSGAINITASGVAAISGSSVTNNGIAQLGPGVT